MPKEQTKFKWDSYKLEIRRLYIGENKTLGQLREALEKLDPPFKPGERALKAHLQLWGFTKNRRKLLSSTTNTTATTSTSQALSAPSITDNSITTERNDNFNGNPDLQQIIREPLLNRQECKSQRRMIEESERDLQRGKNIARAGLRLLLLMKKVYVDLRQWSNCQIEGFQQQLVAIANEFHPSAKLWERHLSLRDHPRWVRRLRCYTHINYKRLNFIHVMYEVGTVLSQIDDGSMATHWASAAFTTVVPFLEWNDIFQWHRDGYEHDLLKLLKLSTKQLPEESTEELRVRVNLLHAQLVGAFLECAERIKDGTTISEYGLNPVKTVVRYFVEVGNRKAAQDCFSGVLKGISSNLVKWDSSGYGRYSKSYWGNDLGLLLMTAHLEAEDYIECIKLTEKITIFSTPNPSYNSERLPYIKLLFLGAIAYERNGDIEMSQKHHQGALNELDTFSTSVASHCFPRILFSEILSAFVTAGQPDLFVVALERALYYRIEHAKRSRGIKWISNTVSEVDGVVVNTHRFYERYSLAQVYMERVSRTILDYSLSLAPFVEEEIIVNPGSGIDFGIFCLRMSGRKYLTSEHRKDYFTMASSVFTSLEANVTKIELAGRLLVDRYHKFESRLKRLAKSFGQWHGSKYLDEDAEGSSQEEGYSSENGTGMWSDTGEDENEMEFEDNGTAADEDPPAMSGNGTVAQFPSGSRDTAVEQQDYVAHESPYPLFDFPHMFMSPPLPDAWGQSRISNERGNR